MFQARHLDRIPIWKTGWRKWVTFQEVSSSKGAGPYSQEEFLARWSAIQNTAWRSKSPREMTIAFWKMESLGSAYGEAPPPGSTLSDPRLPTEIRPIAHTGLGVAAVEVGCFDPGRISERIDSLADPNFRLFAYESLGAMLGAYEVPLPKSLVGLKPLRRPEPRAFISYFEPEIQRLISVGYGRILYFNSLDTTQAIRRIGDRPFLEPFAAVQGVAFAYAMVNHLDFWVVLDTDGEFADPRLRIAFRSGLIYALEFWEWEAPGFLRSLHPPSRRSAELIRVAQMEIDACRARGRLNAFLVEDSLWT